jgi:hypothetical protein
VRYVPKDAPPGSVVFDLTVAVKGWGVSSTSTDKGKWYTPEEFEEEIERWMKRLSEYATKARELSARGSEKG